MRQVDRRVHEIIEVVPVINNPESSLADLLSISLLIFFPERVRSR